MRDRALKKLADLQATRPWWMLLVVFLLTVFFVFWASQLTISMRTSDMLPAGDPKVVQFNKIIDEFATATSLVVVVQGDEERMKEFADDLAPRILELRDSADNDKFQKEINQLNEKIDNTFNGFAFG